MKYPHVSYSKRVIYIMEVNALWLFSPMLTDVLTCTHMIRATYKRMNKMKPILLSSCLQVSSKLQGFMGPQKNPFCKIDDKIRAVSKQLTDFHNKYEAVNMPGSHCIFQVEQLLHLDSRVLFQNNLGIGHDIWFCVLYLHELIFILGTFLLHLKTTDLGRNLLPIRLIHRGIHCFSINVVVHIYALPRHKWQSWDVIYCFLLSLYTSALRRKCPYIYSKFTSVSPVG